MSSFLGVRLDVTPGQKLLGQPWLKVRIALVSALVLVVGALLAPRAAQPVSVPDASAVPLLGEQARREAARPVGGLQSVAAGAARFSLAMPPPTSDTAPSTLRDYSPPLTRLVRPAGFGVVVSAAGDVLTHESALEGRATARVQTATGAFEDARIVAYEPATGLTLLRVPVATPLEAPALASRAEAGALVAAVGRWEGRVIAQPAFISSVGPDAYTIASPGDPLLPGSPVYNSDGQLLAIAAGGHQSGRAFPAAEALARLAARAAAGRAHPPSIGVAFQPLDGELTRAFGQPGALVSEVIEGGPADAAGLIPGDLLVGINDGPIDSSDAALRTLAALASDSETVLRVVRDGRSRTLTVTVGSALAMVALARSAELEEAGPLPEARTLWTAEQLRSAGIPAAARVLRIEGRAVTSRSQALRELRRTRPSSLVYLLHERRRFFASIGEQP